MNSTKFLASSLEVISTDIGDFGEQLQMLPVLISKEISTTVTQPHMESFESLLAKYGLFDDCSTTGSAGAAEGGCAASMLNRSEAEHGPSGGGARTLEASPPARQLARSQPDAPVGKKNKLKKRSDLKPALTAAKEAGFDVPTLMPKLA